MQSDGLVPPDALHDEVDQQAEMVDVLGELSRAAFDGGHQATEDQRWQPPFGPFVNGPSIGLPHVGVDVPHLKVDVITPLPDGNIADRMQRWALIRRDTLPAYQATLESGQARDIIATPVEGRVADQRISAQADELVRRLADWQARPGFDRHVGWDAGW